MVPSIDSFNSPGSFDNLGTLRKGVLLERTYIHSRQLPLDHSRERPHVSRDPVSLAPRLPPTYPGRRKLYPPREAAGWGPADRRPPADALACGAPASGASRAPEIHSVNFAREVHPVTLAGEASRGQTVGGVIPLLSRVSLNVFQAFNQNPTPLRRLRSAVAFHSARAVATSFLFFLPFQTPEPQRAAYLLSNLTRTYYLCYM